MQLFLDTNEIQVYKIKYFTVGLISKVKTLNTLRFFNQLAYSFNFNLIQ